MRFSSLPYLVIGALIYWFCYGNPTVMTAIPFVGMLFLWPFFVLYKFVMWAMFWFFAALLAIFVLGGGYLAYDHWKIKRARAARMAGRFP